MKPKAILRIVALAVIGAAFAWILLRLNWQELGQRLAGASWGYFALMLAAWVVVVLLRPVRFLYLINLFGHARKPRYGTIWAAMMLASSVNSFAPMRAGDALMTVFLRQRLGIGVHRSLTVIVADWACDFICVTAAFLGALVFAPAIAAWTDHAVVVLIAMLLIGIVGLFGILRYRSHALAIFSFCLARIVPRWQVRGLEIADEILTSLGAIATPRIAVPLMLISTLIWALTGLSYWFGLRAMLVDPPAAAAAFNMSAVALSFAVPLGPGGMGAFEAASVLALSVFDIPLEVAIVFAVIAHIAQLGTVLLMTGLATLTGKVDFRALQEDVKRQ